MSNKLLDNSYKLFQLNFGPQHPAAHGVLRLILTLDGEKIISIDPHIGLLHRGTEKLMEYKTSIQSIPYIDRLDYVSIISNEHGLALFYEKMFQVFVPLIFQYQRVMFLELTRIINHLMALSTHRIDVGALTPFLWVFEEREKLFEIYEQRSGARIHARFIRIGGCKDLVDDFVIQKIYRFIKSFKSRINEIEELLTQSRIWKQRTIGVGILTSNDVFNLNCSGVIRRSSGIIFDVRKICSYEVYDNLDFYIPVGINGDCYDRYLLRIFEIYESLKIIEVCLNFISSNNNINFLSNVKKNKSRDSIKYTIENVINHFKFFSENYTSLKKESYISVEAPKGEFGIFGFFEKDSNYRYRIKFKRPGLFHLFRSNLRCRNHLLADLVTIIGTQDIVFGEIDR